MYEYGALKKELFTDDGQRMFLKARDFVDKALDMAGAVRMAEVMNAIGSGDSWTMLACVDRLVELGEIREITQENTVAQRRVFVRE